MSDELTEIEAEQVSESIERRKVTSTVKRSRTVRVGRTKIEVTQKDID